MNTQFELYRRQVLEQITWCIDNRHLTAAKELIQEYEKIVSRDSEVYSMKAVIAILENRLDDAEAILADGVANAGENFDMLYNMAYIYVVRGELVQAYNFYKKALSYASETQAFDLKDKINHLRQEIRTRGLKKFIVLSSCRWGAMLQRPHHMAESLSRQPDVTGVEFIQPAARADVQRSDISLDSAVDYSLSQTRNHGKVHIHMPVICYHDNKMLFNNTVALVQSMLANAVEEIIILCYYPAHINVINALQGSFRLVYDCVDDHNDLEYSYWSHKADREWEQLLSDRAEIILTTSSSLYLSKTVMENRNNVYLSKNAVRHEDVLIPDGLPCPPELAGITCPRICYMGAVDRWFNEELFYKLVRENRDKAFVVIGPVREGMLAQREPNLYLLGVIEHSRLKNYLSHMNVGIIPFKDDINLIVNCDPIKMYEYLACGLPVVATNMPELALGKYYIRTCGSFADFNKAVNDFCFVKPNNADLTAFVRDNTWEQRAKQLLDILNDRPGSRVRNSTISALQSQWDAVLANSDNPILMSMYSLIIAKRDVKRFRKLAEAAYTKLPIKYNLRNYVNSLVLNGAIDRAVSVVLKDNNVKEPYKAEVIYTAIHGKKQLKKQLLVLKIMYCIDNYFEIRRLLPQISDSKKIIENANYWFEVGQYQEAFNAYQSLYDDYIRSHCNVNLFESPLSAFNYGLLFKMAQETKKSEKVLARYEKLRNKYFHYNNNLDERKIIDRECVGLTVLIPTRNRLKLLERCITHFESINDSRLKVTLFILDASDEGVRIEILKMLKHHKSIDIKFAGFDKDVLGYERIANVLPEVKDEFCCLCADDDFLHKEGIIKSIEILTKDQDVITVKGETYIYLNNDLNKIYNFSRDSCEALIENNPVARLIKLVQKWVPQLLWLVFRKESIQIIIDNFTAQALEKRLPVLFQEYLWYFYIPLYGKVVNIDAPLNIRDESPASGSYTYPGFFSYIMDKSFNRHYCLFKEGLLKPFEQSKEIYTELKDRADEIMSAFLINSWGLQPEYVRVNDGIFDLELLIKGIEQIQHTRKEQFLEGE